MKKVLVLEDESSIRSFIVINLRRAGYEVVEAESGEEALEKLSLHSDVRVALLDIMLPGIDGFEVCRRIRATNATIGKADFGDDALKSNLQALLLDLIKAKPATSKGQYLQKISLSSTMGPGVTVDQASLALK